MTEKNLYFSKSFYYPVDALRQSDLFFRTGMTVAA